ncbi:nitrate ABC transporter [Thermus scotoductus]|uniref:Nitrate ABC transporter n=1 Tax=Thermus scotoductus TaxID=37636 RepID=A0A430S8U4_THESC|nr:CmpA/NrtA family ABC transporter substrate-binding protein [Thermus scotoductus]RTG95311.1 nitrate ABC transporter [Thermus scotoductus]RTH10271.1 nitrate ABC transporter [Thermus scotoductus]RTH11034.1 nitrate ABC transporter [Thermus scotoductus]RTH11514.1 nitrate ABC transporter [Thermus scotoductus]RTH27598.1 nitrate ABC transporter [Thermus scotoductus]
MKRIARREVLKKGLALGIATTGLVRGQARSRKLRIGFIALTDCASVVMAKELGLYQKHGVDVELVKEASWATTRDHLLSGEIVAAHTLFGLPFSVYTGIGGPAGRVLRIAMVLNNNGQAITLSSQDFGGKVGFKDLDGAGKAILAKKREGKPLTFAMTFPGGTHDLWLRYWLGACGVNPVKDVRIIVVPPPQMVANMGVGSMDGFCVGEPWNGVAVKQGIGFTALASQDIWKHHPEKALVFNHEFFRDNPEEARAITKAVLEASKWLDNPANRRTAAKVIARRQYVNADPSIIEARLLGVYDLGGDLGRHTYTDDYMLFHNGGQTNFPRKSHAIWFLAQYRRWGMLKGRIDYEGIAETILAQDFYISVAKELSIPIPNDDMRPLSGFIDGVTFDPKDPEGSIRKYKVRV